MNNRKFFSMLSLILAGGMAASDAWSGEAGRVQFVQGVVQVSDSVGRVQPLQKGDAVNEGDTVISASEASAQIRMLDGGFIAIRPNTRMKFDQFRFNGKADGTERNFFSLFKGAFRAVTGLIGRTNKANYRVTTPAATIGIRGTDYEAVVVEPSAAKVALADMPLVVADVTAPTIGGGGFSAAIVNVGAIEMGTDKGKVLLQPGQGMVISYGMNQMPVIKPLDPALFEGAKSGKPNAQGGGGKNEGNKEGGKKEDGGKKSEAPQDNSTADNTTQNQTAAPVAGAVAPASPPPTTITQLPITTTGGANLTGGAITTTLPSVGQGGIAYFSTNAANGISNGFSDMVKYSSDVAGLVSFASTTGGFSGSRGTATIVDGGSILLSATETMGWGRWAGTGATVAFPQSVAMPAFNLHYVGGNPVSLMPVTGTANFILAGSTRPTDATGNVGQVTSATATTNFTTATLNVGINLSFGVSNYAATGRSVYSANGLVPISALSVTCTGCPTGPLPTGQFAGAFVGANATGLGLVYHITNSAAVANGGSGDIAGALAFKR